MTTPTRYLPDTNTLSDLIRNPQGRIDTILDAIEVLPLDSPADRHCAGIRATLEAQGTSIGPNDLLIAAHTLSQAAVLVTANRSEFARVPGLTTEDWLQS